MASLVQHLNNERLLRAVRGGEVECVRRILEAKGKQSDYDLSAAMDLAQDNRAMVDLLKQESQRRARRPPSAEVLMDMVASNKTAACLEVLKVCHPLHLQELKSEVAGLMQDAGLDMTKEQAGRLLAASKLVDEARKESL